MKVIALAIFLSLAFLSHLPAQTYEGKTIKIVVGLPAGDAYDLYARMLAAHMGKYIPGNPNFLVQNMPGSKRLPRKCFQPIKMSWTGWKNSSANKPGASAILIGAHLRRRPATWKNFLW